MVCHSLDKTLRIFSVVIIGNVVCICFGGGVLCLDGDILVGALLGAFVLETCDCFCITVIGSIGSILTGFSSTGFL